jgi:hypothetical protein
MAKRVHIKSTHTYMAARERNTSAGAKGTFIGKWTPSTSSVTHSTLGTAQAKAGYLGATTTIKKYGNTLKWLGGADQYKK